MELVDRYAPVTDDPEAFRAACARPLPTTVRVNELKTTTAAATDALAGAGVGATPAVWSPTVLRLDTDAAGGTLPYYLGWIHGQEEVSCLPAHILDPQPGETIVDLAAAPGGKATQLADLMDDTGTVIANDVNLGRLYALRHNSERLGVTNLVVTHQDGRHFSLNPLGSAHTVDRVLVDAPCSCEGTLRKSPHIVADWDPHGYRGLQPVQTDLLGRAVEMTRPGGVVVYATCTFAPEENEAVVDSVLSSHPCSIDTITLPAGLEAAPGLQQYDAMRFDDSLRETIRIYPHQNDTGGFYVARLRVEG
ncbi:UNVERIFIED_CONTAM: SAM-dependent methyltransferase [Euhalothece sp. KZN 001]